MSKVSVFDLIEIAERMSQEMQDFIDVARQSGSSLPGTEGLLNEWNEAYRKYNIRSQHGSFSTIEGAMAKTEKSLASSLL